MGWAIDEVSYNGVHWKDIDWDRPCHVMIRCNCCGSDAAEGHQTFCRYLAENQQSPAGRSFLEEEIRKALEREAQEKVNASVQKTAGGRASRPVVQTRGPRGSHHDS